MSRYFDPTNDVAFKRLFGTEQHKPLLVSFLNAVLSLKGEHEIKSVEFLTNEQVPLINGNKTTILDIKCTDESSKQYIVEIQNKKLPSFIKRTQFYVAHSYVSQIPVGAEYMHLKQVILLAIANHELFPNKENVISYHRTLDTHTFEHDLKDMCYVFIELPKFTKTEDELETVQDKWIYFFNNWDKSMQVPAKMQEQELIEAYQSMEQFNWNGTEREAYIKANIALVDEFDARMHAREEGRKEGRQKQKIESAKALLKEALSIAQISKATGLREEEIQGLAALESPKKSN